MYTYNNFLHDIVQCVHDYNTDCTTRHDCIIIIVTYACNMKLD